MDGGLSKGDVVDGRYRVARSLGSGGSAHTYVAETIATGEPVALKRFRLKEAGTWKSLELFEREARVLKSLAHPCIPRFIDAFSVEGAEGPTFYIAQALADGSSLQQWIDAGGRVDEAHAKSIASEILAVLSYLHALTPPVVHRDVKPANLIRTTDGRLVLVDFGAARVDATDTQVGGTTVVGTYGFMAAEQFRGVALPATDLYGLGATLVFLLTHKTPDQLPQKRLRVQLPAELGISKPFAAWIGKLLEPAPEDRFGSAGEALSALRDPKALAKATSPGRKRVAILGGVLAFVCVAGAAGLFMMKRYFDRVAPPVEPNAALAGPHPSEGTAVFKTFPPPGRQRYDRWKNVKKVEAHNGLVSVIDVTADGKRLVTASFDRSAKVWDTESWTAVATLSGHSARVTGVAFADGGKLVVTAGDTTVRVWSADSGKQLASASLDATPIQVAAAPDGKSVVVSDLRGRLHAFSLPELKPGAVVEHSPNRRLLAVAYSPDGRFVVSGSDDGVTRKWTAPDLGAAGSARAHAAAIDAISVSADGAMYGVSSDDGRISTWHTDGGPPALLHVSPTEVWSGAISPDATLLASGDREGSLRVYDVRTQQFVFGAGLNAALSALKFSPDGRKLYLGGGAGELFALPIDDPKDRMNVPKPRADVAKEVPRPAQPVDEADWLIDSYHGDGSVLKEAWDVLEKVLAANARDARALVAEGRIERARSLIVGKKRDPKRLDAAEALARRALDIDATLPSAHLLLGAIGVDRAWLVEGDDRSKLLDEAEKELTLVGSDAPSRVDAKKAYIAEARGQHEEAVRLATRAVEEATDVFEADVAYDTLEANLVSLGRIEAADAADAKLVDLEPHSAWTKGNYGFFQLRAGDPMAARSTLKDALSMMNYGAAHTSLSYVDTDLGISQLWEHDDAKAAREWFDESLKEDPRSADATYGLVACDAFEAAEKHEPCAKCAEGLERVLELRKDHPAARFAKKALAKE